MSYLTTVAGNRQSMVQGSMTLAEIERFCEQARRMGCDDGANPVAFVEPSGDPLGGGIVRLSVALP